MPNLGKHTMTRYLGSDCRKQLRLLMAPEVAASGQVSERDAEGMPPKQPPRPGLQHITAAGDEWAASRLLELETLVGPDILRGARTVDPRVDGVAFSPSDLRPALEAGVAPGVFLAEHQFNVVETFLRSFDPEGHVRASSMRFDDLRPDLLEVRPGGTSAKRVQPDGAVVDVATDDSRLPLRVIDIKLTSQPGPGYFAEVVYYSVALAAWIEENSLDDRYFVSADPAIWPGSHEASALRSLIEETRSAGAALPGREDCIEAVAADLEVAPVPVFVSSLHHFFEKILPDVLETPWRELPFHVSSRCRGCDFLGDYRGSNNPGGHPDHCMPMAAETGHLSQIPFISRGASELLRQSDLRSVSDLAATDASDDRFGSHHSLRSQRTVISGRARALDADEVLGIPNEVGTSAVLPRASDLSIYVTADFDASSAVTFAIGVAGYWSENPWAPNASTGERPRRVWATNRTLTVDRKSLVDEERVVLQFLGRIDEMIQEVRQLDDARNQSVAARRRTPSTVQIYVWDQLTYRHLSRVVGRHLTAVLAASQGVRTLAWMFPPEELQEGHQTRGEPVVTIVGDVIRSLVALPIPHHYSMLETARSFHTAGLNDQLAEFRMPSLFEDPLSDQIPSERAHDMWTRGTNFAVTIANLDRAVRTRLRALEEVVKRLRADLGSQLGRRAARLTSIAVPASVSKLTTDEMLLLAFAKLNAAVVAQEVAQVRAMPPHEREARFASLRLNRLLKDGERTHALNALGLRHSNDIDVFEVRQGSEQAGFKEGDFLCALVPERQVEILDWPLSRFLRDRGVESQGVYDRFEFVQMAEILGLTLLKFDRERRLVALKLTDYRGRDQVRQQLTRDGLLDLEHWVSVEKVAKEFFVPKLQLTLQAIGRTPKSGSSPIAVRALGRATNPHRSPRVPIEDVLWDASAMSMERAEFDTDAARRELLRRGRTLNESQWEAFDHALSHRLSLIWGPPGTGKSRTLSNIVLGAAIDAARKKRNLRILISSTTYSAVDNVLGSIAHHMADLLPESPVVRVRSEQREEAQGPVVDCVIGSGSSWLEDRLSDQDAGVSIVGATSQQVHKLAKAMGGAASPAFDLIVLDEASQMDVGNAVLSLATLAEGGRVVAAGDPLQLPPIHQVDPPVGAESLVGSIYNFLREHHGIEPKNLLVNYRSNEEIVALAQDADYPAALRAHAPALRLNFVAPVPSSAQPPPGWPETLPWGEGLHRLLNPEQPVTCVVYQDGVQGQSNPFEADLVAGLVWLLGGRLADGLDGSVDSDGVPQPGSAAVYDQAALLTRGVGVVTPHRAQQAMISSRIAAALPNADAALVKQAVDTVERFQGQERDVIIASYAVGDPDTIAGEDEFLMSLNRFNVMASRARAKLIVLVSEELVQHLPVDVEVLRATRLLKSFVDIRCSNRENLVLPRRDGVVDRAVGVSLRWS